MKNKVGKQTTEMKAAGVCLVLTLKTEALCMDPFDMQCHMWHREWVMAFTDVERDWHDPLWAYNLHLPSNMENDQTMIEQLPF